ncbi:MAG TPA: 4-hydroxy-3-methylbut-2-enyl diphosphate reductase [Vicinamibacterales bacterium]|nr:4-hydroxy-3-methylbut-2-enyl diphosphate reductase [Vicinamibacterales bacterium]
MPSVIFKKGLQLKHAVAGMLAESYHSALVEQIKADGFQYRSGRLTVHLAAEFGFCYGVDRAVDYAYQAHTRFPDRRVVLAGEIIHNPHVNDKLRALGVVFLGDEGAALDDLQESDVVIVPAFGLPVATWQRLDARGCTLVDTTCGSVLNVWKNVRRYAQDGFTAVIHGKAWHEETQATASQALQYPNGRCLVVKDRPEAAVVCDYVRHGGDRARFLETFSHGVSDGFDPDRDLSRIGLANQTTMLMSESMAIGEMFRAAMRNRYGEADLPARFRSFDTICSATQDRQDAVVALLDSRPLDLVMVIGGYNSSNTCNLARICAERVPTYHVAGPECLLSASELRHRPVAGKDETLASGWLRQSGPLAVGLTSGASTPDNLVGATIERLVACCGDGATA